MSTATPLVSDVLASAISASRSANQLRAADRTLRPRSASLADREQALDAGLPRIAADFGVQLVGAVAELAHVAEHQPARAGEAARTHRGPP